tara:strand:+ start:140638 stop:140970 length:333 start_codon:yes stop_codon:yes gene_type:complete
MFRNQGLSPRALSLINLSAIVWDVIGEVSSLKKLCQIKNNRTSLTNKMIIISRRSILSLIIFIIVVNFKQNELNLLVILGCNGLILRFLGNGFSLLMVYELTLIFLFTAI